MEKWHHSLPSSVRPYLSINRFRTYSESRGFSFSMGMRTTRPFFSGFSGEDYWLKMFFAFFSRTGRCTSSLGIRPIAWKLGYLKMLSRTSDTYFLLNARCICFLFLFCGCRKGWVTVGVRQFLMSFLVEVTFDEWGFGREAVLFAGILDETEELSAWERSYCILKSFSLSFLRREWLIFL